MDRAGGNLKTIVVVLGESATGEGHPFVHGDLVLTRLSEAGSRCQAADPGANYHCLSRLAHPSTSGVNQRSCRTPE